MTRKQVRQVCEDCGATTGLVSIRGYDWDNPNEDEQGSISVIIGYHCSDRAACKARRVYVNMPDDTYNRAEAGGETGQREGIRRWIGNSLQRR